MSKFIITQNLAKYWFCLLIFKNDNFLKLIYSFRDQSLHKFYSLSFKIIFYTYSITERFLSSVSVVSSITILVVFVTTTLLYLQT